ncbi:hypothetical protein GP486_000946 [Trichoglossum hirsutum]|uniref:Nuclear matrix protein n=1 Tax=Trichoglossum hirsutum TaxID=265104 RepID=A0A9P8LHL5_9PEZI|nr:hypothetical protein GP486_000946 [Trichoglossum hirsutum]
MATDTLPSVRHMMGHLQTLLEKAGDIKPAGSLDPPLTPASFGDSIDQIKESGIATLQHASTESAFRSLFFNFLVRAESLKDKSKTSIEDPSFTKIWNLLDIAMIFSHNDLCEPGLPFWLIEELLDSQTIDGCRRVFDYLESRRERLIAKNFKAIHLVILRFCNELLRRLSRAEDTVFCGRVFIFLFQSFPLGDRSSVNLRGEFHVENTTTFDESPQMMLEFDEVLDANGKSHDQAINSGDQTEDAKKTPKTVTFDTEENATECLLDTDSLYPIFWSLQHDFSEPTRLFKSENFESFKKGLDLTIAKFIAVHEELESRGTLRMPDENKRGIKRKRGEGEDDLVAGFNPKYLTSRDLFELEISELAFRRHILVQALILIDFLLSLTPKAKEKLSDLVSSNRAVLYSHALSPEDTKWAIDTRASVANYLQQGPEGKFYYRMVDTVLSRDKNWVRWKAENCQSFERPAFSAQEFLGAKSGAQKACADRRIRTTPLGTLDLNFLSDAESTNGLDKLKNTDRYNIPDEESFRMPILDDELAIDVAKDEDEKQLAVSARSSKIWRALRIASKTKLNLFDRIDDGQNLDVLFKTDSEGDKVQVEMENMRDSGDGKAGETPAKREATGPETPSALQLVGISASAEGAPVK